MSFFQFFKNCINLVIFESQTTLCLFQLLSLEDFQHCFAPEKSVLPARVSRFCFCSEKTGSYKTFILEGCYMCPSLQGSLIIMLFSVNNWELIFSTIISSVFKVGLNHKG